MTELLASTPAGIARAAELLREGAVVAFPTDTVYGVGVAASHPERVSALFALKQRPPEKQIPMLVADLDQAVAAGAVADDRSRAIAAALWPGALTIVLPLAEGGSQAYRAPDHPVALALVRAAGPLYATSANISGQPDTLGADDVQIAFATSREGLAAIVDGGAVPGGVASTVIDCSVTPAVVLRPGPISRDRLATIVEVA